MKQRLLVMNGQKLVQHEEKGQWITVKVEKAPAIKPGIYNLYLSTAADRAAGHDGVLVHADKEYVYQQVGKMYVRHDRSVFEKIPDMGSNFAIRYQGGKAIAAPVAVKLGRKLSQ